jgi:hypothetical protein
MSTLWQTQSKRNVGNESTIFDDPIVIFDSLTALFGGSNPPTEWTTINKSS